MRKELSLAKIDANRQNSLSSTGPRTLQGKEALKTNPLKHGIFASEVVNKAPGSGESIRMFNKLLRELTEDFSPVGKMEHILVERIATTVWRLRRVYRAENMATNSPKTNDEMPNVSIIEVRMPRTLDDPIAVHDPLTQTMSREELLEELAYLKKDLKSAQRVVNNFTGRNPKAIIKPALPSTDEVHKILKYEAALQRPLSQVTDQLLRLQSRRKGEPIPPSLNVHIENTDS